MPDRRVLAWQEDEFLEEVPFPQLTAPYNDRSRGVSPSVRTASPGDNATLQLTRSLLLQGGFFSTAADFGRFGRMILRGGELDGVRYLSEAAVAEMTGPAPRNEGCAPPQLTCCCGGFAIVDRVCRVRAQVRARLAGGGWGWVRSRRRDGDGSVDRHAGAAGDGAHGAHGRRGGVGWRCAAPGCQRVGPSLCADGGALNVGERARPGLLQQQSWHPQGRAEGPEDADGSRRQDSDRGVI